MLKQKINGLMPLTIAASGSSADMAALQAVLAGEVESYESKGNGGTAMPTIPNPLNRKSFIVGAKTPTGRISCYLNIPHVKVSAHYNEIIAGIVGTFDAGYDSTVKAGYCTMKFDA